MALLRNTPLNDLVEGTALRDITLSTLVGGTALRDIPLDTELSSSPSPAYMEAYEYSVTAGGTNWMIVRFPEGYDDNPSTDWPTVIFYPGDGGDPGDTLNNPTVRVTGQVMSGSGTSWSATFENDPVTDRPVRQVGWGTVIVKVSGVEVARGRMDGTIVGTGVTGTMAHKSANGAVSLTFDSTPGATPTLDYVYSAVFEAGAPMYVNDTDDLDESMLFVIVQNHANDVNFDEARHYDDARTHMLANFNVDTNRIIAAGLSRGAFFVNSTLLINNYTEIAGFLSATPIISGTYTYSNYTNRGIYIISGQNDGTASPPNSSMMNSTGAITDYHFYPYFTMYEGTGHSPTIWNTNVYNRATAPFDWVKWALLWSLDIDQQAELHVDYAEETEDIDDWRRAKRAVSFMSGSQTALLTRLSTLKSTIDAGRKRWTIDIGATTTGDTYLENVNFISSGFTAGSTFSSLIDDEGNTTGVGLNVVSQLATGPTNRLNTLQRGANPGHGFGRAHTFDGANMHTTVSTGQIKLTGLDPLKTYRLDFYSAIGQNSVATDSYLQTTINSVTKNIFTNGNNTTKIEYTGVAPNGSNEIVIDVNMATSGANGLFQVFTAMEEN